VPRPARWRPASAPTPSRWACAAARRRPPGPGAGLTALILALLSCYGTLALVALLPLLGLGLALDDGLWAGTIALFVLLSLAALAAGLRHRVGLLPLLPGAAGGGLVLYALLVDYHALVELAGFVLLGAAVLWDLRRRRRQEARVLGLEAQHHG